MAILILDVVVPRDFNPAIPPPHHPLHPVAGQVTQLSFDLDPCCPRNPSPPRPGGSQGTRETEERMNNTDGSQFVSEGRMKAKRKRSTKDDSIERMGIAERYATKMIKEVVIKVENSADEYEEVKYIRILR